MGHVLIQVILPGQVSIATWCCALLADACANTNCVVTFCACAVEGCFGFVFVLLFSCCCCCCSPNKEMHETRVKLSRILAPIFHQVESCPLSNIRIRANIYSSPNCKRFLALDTRNWSSDVLFRSS